MSLLHQRLQKGRRKKEKTSGHTGAVSDAGAESHGAYGRAATGTTRSSSTFGKRLFHTRSLGFRSSTCRTAAHIPRERPVLRLAPRECLLEVSSTDVDVAAGVGRGTGVRPPLSFINASESIAAFFFNLLQRLMNDCGNANFFKSARVSTLRSSVRFAQQSRRSMGVCHNLPCPLFFPLPVPARLHCRYSLCPEQPHRHNRRRER